MTGTAPDPTRQETELLVVMPVYNEEESVRKVVFEWFDEIENWTEQFTFLAIDASFITRLSGPALLTVAVPEPDSAGLALPGDLVQREGGQLCFLSQTRLILSAIVVRSRTSRRDCRMRHPVAESPKKALARNRSLR